MFALFKTEVSKVEIAELWKRLPSPAQMALTVLQGHLREVPPIVPTVVPARHVCPEI